ncbi:hypothetical protein Tco_0267418 [Tanacetum coccineum]
MVINLPCLTDTKNWLFQFKRHLLASTKQTALGKDFSNPLMADSLPKTIWLSIHHVLELAIPGQTATGKESSNPFMAGSLPKLYISVIHFKVMRIDASKQWRIDDADAEVTFIDETSNDARNKNNKISNIN